jgi:hypothetical protein
MTFFRVADDAGRDGEAPGAEPTPRRAAPAQRAPSAPSPTARTHASATSQLKARLGLGTPRPAPAVAGIDEGDFVRF